MCATSWTSGPLATASREYITIHKRQGVLQHCLRNLFLGIGCLKSSTQVVIFGLLYASICLECVRCHGGAERGIESPAAYFSMYAFVGKSGGSHPMLIALGSWYTRIQSMRM